MSSCRSVKTRSTPHRRESNSLTKRPSNRVRLFSETILICRVAIRSVLWMASSGWSKTRIEEALVNAFFAHLKKTHSKCDTIRYMQSKWDPDFSYSMLRTMLTSEFYVGTYRGIPYCPAYLTKEERDEILEISKRNIKNTPSGRIYYFTGLIRCPVCGQLLCGTGCSSVINRKTGEKKDILLLPLQSCNHRSHL